MPGRMVGCLPGTLQFAKPHASRAQADQFRHPVEALNRLLEGGEPQVF